MAKSTKNTKNIYVTRSYMANGDTRKYRWFDTRFFVSEKKAKVFQKEGTGYRGSSRPRFNHATVDIEVYELKKVVLGKRVKRFSRRQNWYMEPDGKGKVDIVITEQGRKQGLRG